MQENRRMRAVRRRGAVISTSEAIGKLSAARGGTERPGRMHLEDSDDEDYEDEDSDDDQTTITERSVDYGSIFGVSSDEEESFDNELK